MLIKRIHHKVVRQIEGTFVQFKFDVKLDSYDDPELSVNELTQLAEKAFESYINPPTT